MTKILDELQARALDAKKRLDEATAAFQIAERTRNEALQNWNIWNLAAGIEARDEQQRQAIATESQLPLPSANPEATFVIERPDEDEPGIEDLVDAVGSVNKTDIVRGLLKQHPTGMTAIEIWKEVRADFRHRPYLYSVLKRLRDRDEVTMRQKKYCPKLTPKTIDESKVQEESIH